MPRPARVDIPLFPGNKRIAVTTSWDDGVIYDRQIVANFNAWGLKGTFNLNSGLLVTSQGQQIGWKPERYLRADEIATLFAGHEVAIHTVTHPHLPRLDPAQLIQEVMDDREALENLVGYPVRGMAYPFGTYNQAVIDALRSMGVVYSRTCENRDNPWVPAEPLAWASTGHMFADIPERWSRFYDNPRGAGLFFVWGHSYEFFERSDDRFSPADIERIFRPLSGKPDVWYATNIELFDYEQARRRLVIAANRKSAFNPSALPVTVLVEGRTLEVPAGKTVVLA